SVDDLSAMGFGEKTSVNLVSQLRRSSIEQIEDWRFLAAFGVVRMGTGNCENLLKYYSLADIFELNLEQISNIDGFAELTAKMIVSGLSSIKLEFDLLSQYRFNLEITPLQKDLADFAHSLGGKKIIFTGKMSSPREEMKKHAKSIGIQVVSSVSAKTDYLVIGEKVGKKKIESAIKLGVEILNEVDYLALIK
ncbi:MAG: DNA ligase, partial [Candidatus Thioglobus sp.]|nr:DNA ligase [Candidatus Thioglobus sp.]